MNIRALAARALASVPALDGAFRRLVWSRIHFPEEEMRLISKLPRNSFDVSLDVGAAQGFFTWILSRKSRTVYSFEPGEVLGRLMEISVIGSNVKFFKAAIGRGEGTVSFFTPETGLFGATASLDNPISSSPRAARREVRQMSIDATVLPELEPTSTVDFIKIDIEGYELEAINGAVATIERFHPIVLCEIERRHSPHCGEVFRFFHSRGYSCVHVVGGVLKTFPPEQYDNLPVLGKLLGGPDYKFLTNEGEPYFNNFFFQHPASRLDLVTFLERYL
jgi:FkbM family methyltransferase